MPALRQSDDGLAHGVDQRGQPQLALAAQPGHDDLGRPWHLPGGEGGVAAVLEDLVRARGLRVQAAGQGLRHGSADELVDHGLGAGQAAGFVVPQQQRPVDKLQVAVAHADLQRRQGRGGRRLRRPTAGGRAEAQAAQAGFVQRAVGGRRLHQHEAAAAVVRRAGARAAAPPCRQLQAGQLAGLAGFQQVAVAAEDARVVHRRAQRIVRNVGRTEHRNARQLARGPGHGAVTVRRGNELQARRLRPGGEGIVHHLVVHHGGRLLAGHVHHMAGRQLGLAGQQLPGLARRGQGVVAGRREAGLQLVAQLAPQRGVGKLAVAGHVRKGQQFGQAGEAAHDVDDAVGAAGQVQQGELALGGVEAGEPAHRLVGAGVGRAQHQQPAAGQGHQPLPGQRTGRRGDHGAGHQAAHRVGHDAHRHLPRLGIHQRGFQGLQQALRRHPHRQAPVVGHHMQLMAGGQVLQQRGVEVVHQAVGLDAAGLDVDLAQAAQGQRAIAQPHAAVVHLQAAAHGARHQDGHRLARLASATTTAAGAHRRAGARIGLLRLLDGQKAGLAAFGASQALHHPLQGVGVGEVAEVVDQRPARLAEAGPLRQALNAAGHGAGVDDQVVVGVIEPVQRQQLQPRPTLVGLQVAGDGGEVGGGAQRGPAQQLRQRGLRHHRLQPGQGARVGALLHHLEQEVDAVAQPAGWRQCADDRQPAVEPARRQGGATRRAGHANKALHLQAALIQLRQQAFQVGLVGGVVVAQLLRAAAGQQAQAGQRLLRLAALEHARGQRFAHRVAALLLTLGQRQQFAHQAAARVRHQVQPRLGGQLPRQRQRIRHRALRQGEMLQRIHPLAVRVAQRRARGLGRLALGLGTALIALGPERAKAAQQAGHGAVKEDQHGLLPGRQARAIRHPGEARRAVVQAQLVEAGLAPQALALDQLTQLPGRQRRHIHPGKLQRLDGHAGQATLGRGHATPGGRELGRQGPHRQAALAPAHLLAALLAQQVVGTCPQHQAVVEFHLHHLIGRQLQGAAGRLPVATAAAQLHPTAGPGGADIRTRPGRHHLGEAGQLQTQARHGGHGFGGRGVGGGGHGRGLPACGAGSGAEHPRHPRAGLVSARVARMQAGALPRFPGRRCAGPTCR